MPTHATRLIAVLPVFLATAASGQVSMTHLGDVGVPPSVVDQNAASFDVAGLSGVCWLGGDEYAAVMDNSNRVVLFELPVGSDGTIGALSNVRGLTVQFTGDHEGIVSPAAGQILVADETSMSLRKADVVTGVSLGPVWLPSVYAARRANRGLESLALHDGVAWTANEEALTVDGNVANPSTGTIVRLHARTLDPDVELGQWSYIVEPMHGPVIPGGNPGQSGLADLVTLPDGTLLALERSLAFASPFFLTRVFSIDIGGATEVSGLAALPGNPITPASKTLVYQGGHANLEGLCVGPSLAGGDRVMVGVVDNGDPISENTIVVFRLSGLGSGPDCRGDIADDFGVIGADGMVSFGDFLALLGLVGPCPGGTPGCNGDIADDFGSPAPDGQVGFGDFLALLGLVGPCP